MLIMYVNHSLPDIFMFGIFFGCTFHMVFFSSFLISSKASIVISCS